jgi:hypothetical protein
MNKHTLKTHQSNTIYCLKIQGKHNLLKDKNCLCITCDKSFSNKSGCDKHMLHCISTPSGKLIEKLRNDICKLRNDHSSMIEKVRNDSDYMIEKLRNDHSSMIEKVRNDSDYMIGKLRNDNSSKEGMIEKLRNDNSSKEGMIDLMQDKIDRQEAKIISTEKSLIDMKVLQNEVEIYKSQAKESKDCIEQIAKQPKITSSSTTNNIINMHTLDLSDDRMKNIIEEYYNIDYLLAGSKGVAQFTVDKVLTKPNDKMIYSLTDRSREAYNFKNVEGVIEKDTKGRKLREVVYKNGIKEKAFLIANTMVLEDPVKADELKCIEYALEVADLDPNTIRTKEVNDKVEHAYCKELRETSC